MRKIENVDKLLIDEILEDPRKGSELFDFFSNLLPEGKYALLISRGKVHLFNSSDLSASTDVLLALIQYVSLLNQLEDDGYIYVIHLESTGKKLLQKGISPEIWIENDVEKCHLGDFITDEKGLLSIQGKGVNYIEEHISESLSASLCKYVMSMVVPSDKLIAFRKNNFLSDDAIKYRSSFRVALYGLIIALVALFVSIISPFWMTVYNNKHAISTLDSLQYYSATELMEMLVHNTDSLLLEERKKDTVFVESSTIMPMQTKTKKR